jgi:hypothetical protein
MWSAALVLFYVSICVNIFVFFCWFSHIFCSASCFLPYHKTVFYGSSYEFSVFVFSVCLLIDNGVLSLLDCGVSLVFFLVVYDVWSSDLYWVESGIMYCISEYKIKFLSNLEIWGNNIYCMFTHLEKYDTIVSVLTSPVILEGNFLGWVMCLVCMHLALIHETSAEMCRAGSSCECLMIKALICVIFLHLFVWKQKGSFCSTNHGLPCWKESFCSVTDVKRGMLQLYTVRNINQLFWSMQKKPAITLQHENWTLPKYISETGGNEENS